MKHPCIVVDSRLRFRNLSPDWIEHLTRSLTFRNPQYDAAVKFSGVPVQYIQIPKNIEMFTARNGVFSIPRGYDHTRIPKMPVTDERVATPIEEPYPDLQITPTQQQKHVLELFYEDIKSKKERPFGNYLSVMEVSSGKTILTALMARKLKLKTLVLVHTQLIMNAWIDDLCKMYGADFKKQIGIIQGPKALVGPQITLAMAQTWFKRSDHWASWWQEFGCCVFDEVHLCPAKTFFQCIDKSPAKYRFGITGTDKRKDGLHSIMYQVFGTPFYRMQTMGVETENSLPISDVKVIKTYTKLPQTIMKTMSYNLYGRRRYKEVEQEMDGNRDYAGIMETLCSNARRTNLIAKKVSRVLQASMNNSVLVATHRIAHARALKQALARHWNGTIALLINPEGREQIRETERKIKQRKIRCAIATVQLVKTGASIPPLNRLFIATPIGGEQDLEQLIGRIRRKCPGKEDARVYHVVDVKVPMCLRHFNKRALPFYRDRLRVKRFRNVYTA